MFIFFDIGATLISGPDLSPAKYIAEKIYGLTEHDKQTINKHILTTNILSQENLVKYLVEIFDIIPLNYTKKVVSDLWETQLNEPKIVHGGANLLLKLKIQNIPFGFISNIWKPYADSFIRLYGHELVQLENLFLSYQIGVAKPDPDLFLCATDCMDVSPRDCIMVGDSYDNDMCPAIELGMKTVWIINRPEKEAEYLYKVVKKELPRPSLIINSIIELTPDILTSL